MKNVIVIPTYNERNNVRTIIPLVFETLPEVFVVVADDNSPDGTGLEVMELQKKYHNLSLISRKQKDGLGKAYINAFSEILNNKDVRSIIMMDADFSFQLRYLPEMIKKSENYSVVIGSRYVQGSKIIGWNFWRKTLSFFGNFYCNIILHMPIHDYTCGYNVISAEMLRRIDFSKMDATGYAFILELKCLLFEVGATFFEVPITFVDRTDGKSKISWHIIGEGVFAPRKMLKRRYK